MFSLSVRNDSMDDIILIGYGGHGKSVADCIERTGLYRIIGYTDFQEHQSQYTYLGTDDVLEQYLEEGIDKVFICIGYLGKSNLRERIYWILKEKGFTFPVIIDPSAIVSQSAVIEEGSFVGKGAVINAEARIGRMSIINTGAIIEHECIVGEFSHIAVSAVLCGQVKTGKAAFVGANATIIQCMEIGARTIIPAGMTIR